MQRAFTAICLIVALAVCMGFGRPEVKGHLVTAEYTVKAGDNLWDIAGEYMKLNDYGPREIREFYHGIIENNQDVFADRVPGLIKPGDVLYINYFVKDKEE